MFGGNEGMKTLSLCMIVKDGEKYIEQCIESVFSIVSEVIVVDTGSTDSTLKRIERFNPKIFHYKWNDNFADARNHSLEKAISDYILVLDADEVVYEEDLPKLKALLATTNADGISIQFHNFTVENSEESFNTHIGLRMFKKGCFHYDGAIHEQLVLNKKTEKPIMEISEIRVKHYGYLKSNSGVKKHNRNLPILLSLLEQNPKDAFHLFNLGNEYMSLGEHENALKYFDMSDEYKVLSMAYAPHLIYRRASCLHVLNQNEKSLSVLAEGLKHYPDCTDMEFLRGRILYKMKRFTLALESFNNCILMGEAPATLRFFTETHNFRPLIEMAGIYYLLDDYNKALNCYLKALNVNGKRYHVIYDVGKVLNKIHDDKNLVIQNLRNLYADYSFKSNVMVTTDVLLNEKLIEQGVNSYAEYLKENANLDVDDYFLRGRFLFYNKEYEEAFSMFSQSVDEKTKKGILPDTKNRGLEYMAACCLLVTKLSQQFAEIINSMPEKEESCVYLAFIKGNDSLLDKQVLNTISQILSRLLAVEEYDVFQEALSILNQVESKEVLLKLAEVYYNNNYPDMAVSTILRSVKELDIIDSSAVMILNKAFLM